MLIVSFFFYPKWEQDHTEATISWDVSGYYFYLPAFFIYEDYKALDWTEGILKNYSPTSDFQQAFKHSSGNYVMKYPIGQCILMSPFFAIAHCIAKNSHYKADGFSPPYQKSIGIGMLLYMILGLVLFRKVLLLFFSDKLSAFLLFALVLGTNYLNYAAIEQAQTHSTLFTLYCALILCTNSYYKRASGLKALSIGLLVGLMTIIRPTELLSILIPILWGLNNVSDSKERWRHFVQHWKHLFIAFIGLFLMVSIQLIYWKIASGDWIVYSYEDQGFSWLHPHFKDYMFSARSGWLRYAPLLILSIIGLLFIKQLKHSRILVISFSLIFIYVVCAWDVWWFGGRAMVQSYPILMLGLGALILFIQKKHWVLKGSLGVFLILFTYLNLWWTYQAHGGQVQVTDTSDAYWLKTVGRYAINPNTNFLIDNKYQKKGEVTQVKTLFNEPRYRADSSSFESPITISSLGQKYFEKSITFNHFTKATHIRFEAELSFTQKEWNMGSSAQLIMEQYQADKLVLRTHIFPARIMGDFEKKIVYVDAPVLKKTNRIIFKVQNEKSDKAIQLYQIKAYLFNG